MRRYVKEFAHATMVAEKYVKERTENLQRSCIPKKNLKSMQNISKMIPLHIKKQKTLN